ncbi:hypothetical protein, partial [Bacillus sp. SH5-2]|uniref:hypothetical protein n=1 Tax=Bacillus sp. SH5-2 TaxID=2217834 RepID=UPI00142930A7
LKLMAMVHMGSLFYFSFCVGFCKMLVVLSLLSIQKGIFLKMYMNAIVIIYILKDRFVRSKRYFFLIALIIY